MLNISNKAGCHSSVIVWRTEIALYISVEFNLVKSNVSDMLKYSGITLQMELVMLIHLKRRTCSSNSLIVDRIAG